MHHSTETYPSFAAVRTRRLAERRAAAISALRGAEEIARAAGGRLLVFGSLVEGGFHERSDLDVAVLGLAPPVDSRVASDVDTLLSNAGFVVDVVAERFLPAPLHGRVMARGREPSALG